jgi:CBS domain-containing protein
MRISDVMTRDVRVIQPDRTVRDAARLMDELNVGVLPVCDGRRLIGMITDRDITVRSTASGIAPDQHTVREIMTDDVEWCFEDDDVDEIVEIMSAKQIRRVPVVDRSKRLVGIVALGDLAEDSEEQAQRALRRISTPSEPDRSPEPSRARADQTRDRSRARLTDEERRELDRRLSRDDRDRGDPGRRGLPADMGRYRPDERSRGGADLRFRDEDDVRAAFGPFGHPGEEGMRNAQMRGGFGGEGYNNYGEDYRRLTTGRGGGGYPNRRARGSDLLGRREYPGDDSTPEEHRSQNIERAYSLVNEPRDHDNYGVGPGNTRFGNDATGSRGEVRRDDHRGRGPKGYQRSDDRIREDVNERLTDDVMIDASEIEVAVQNREVTLTGTVRNRDEKRRAEDVAESVPGVTHVQNNLRVGQHQAGHPSGTEVGDSGMATGNPGIGTAGTTGGSAAGGRQTGESKRGQRQTT